MFKKPYMTMKKINGEEDVHSVTTTSKKNGGGGGGEIFQLHVYPSNRFYYIVV